MRVEIDPRGGRPSQVRGDVTRDGRNETDRRRDVERSESDDQVVDGKGGRVQGHHRPEIGAAQRAVHAGCFPCQYYRETDAQSGKAERRVQDANHSHERLAPPRDDEWEVVRHRIRSIFNRCDLEMRLQRC